MNTQLPIDACLPALLQALSEKAGVILQAEPGSGKTTRVPLALLSADTILHDKKIIMLEPRRLAARSAARYMASLLGEEAGKTVGYRTRLDTKISTSTRIEVVTEGILTRLLQDDPALSDYAVVIFDEFHERSLQADLGLALVLESQQVLREDLRVLLMSATLDADNLRALMPDASVIRAEGRQYPVETRYRPLPKEKRLLDHVVQVITEAFFHEEGSLLVFLPGESEIRRVSVLLEGKLPADVDLAPLYGQLAASAQDQAIRPAPVGRRKLVLATAIAETSLTIEGIRVVIDAGQLRLPRYDTQSAMTRLVTQRVSAASAEQRRGRAGRLQAGVCYRLWSEDEQKRLQPFSPAEILQADLSATVLELAAWGVRDAQGLAWLDPPPAANWQQAVQLLQSLGALNTSGEISAHGKAMLQLGLPPRLAHLLLCGQERGLGRLAADLAALLSERDILGSDGGVDIHTRLALLREEAASVPVDKGRLYRIKELSKKLQRRSQLSSHPENSEQVGLLLALAFPDFIAKRRKGTDPRYIMANGRGALLPLHDHLANEEWLVVLDSDGDAREARIFLAAPLLPDFLNELPPHTICHQTFVSWDEENECVKARAQKCLGALVLEDKPLTTILPEDIRSIFCEALKKAGLKHLPWTEECYQLQARMQLMRNLEPDTWPDVSDSALLLTLEEWAGFYLGGISRFSQLAGFPLKNALLAQLTWEKQQQLDAFLPSHLTVPSGSSIAIDYCAEHGPVLAVKLQEMFGLMETPQLAKGRITLAIHLLSPAQRPVAVTRDLASFWKNAYAEVRKDLRGRYPKHPWPDDPLSAVAQRGVKHPKSGKSI